MSKKKLQSEDFSTTTGMKVPSIPVSAFNAQNLDADQLKENAFTKSDFEKALKKVSQPNAPERKRSKSE